MWRKLAGPKPSVRARFVHVAGFAAQCLPYRTSPASSSSGRARATRLAGAGRALGAQGVQDVVDAGDGGGALLEQLVRAGAHRAEDAARARPCTSRPCSRAKSAVISAPLRSPASTMTVRVRQARNDAVAPRKVDRVGRHAGRELGDHGAGIGVDDLARQASVLGRVDLVQPVAQDGDGPTAGLERRPMGRRVDAFGQAADDGHAGGGQVARQALGDGAGRRAWRGGCRRGRRPAHRPAREPAAHEQHRRRIGDLAQAGRVVVVEQGQRVGCAVGPAARRPRPAVVLSRRRFSESAVRRSRPAAAS